MKSAILFGLRFFFHNFQTSHRPIQLMWQRQPIGIHQMQKSYKSPKFIYHTLVDQVGLYTPKFTSPKRARFKGGEVLSTMIDCFFLAFQFLRLNARILKTNILSHFKPLWLEKLNDFKHTQIQSNNFKGQKRIFRRLALWNSSTRIC